MKREGGRSYFKSFNTPSIEGFRSRKEWEVVAWRALVAHLRSLRSVEELSARLGVILSPSECRKALFRAAAIDRMRLGKSYREISDELWLSKQTLSAIKKALREQKYRSYYERGKTERKKRVYSPEPSEYHTRRSGRRIRTKYGTLRMPY